MEMLIFVLYGLLLWLILHILFAAYTFIRRKIKLYRMHNPRCWKTNDSIYDLVKKRHDELSKYCIWLPRVHINYPFVIKSDIEIKRVNGYSEEFECISIKKESRYQDYLCFKAFSYNLSKDIFWFKCGR